MKKLYLRNSNLELLRIIAMFFIIANHYINHGAIFFGELPFSIHKVISLCLSAGGRGVCLFLLISGYFSVKSTFNLKRTVTMIVRVWIYSVLIFLLFHFILTPDATFDLKSLVKIFLPNIFGQWWFATTFLVLTLLTPFINTAIHAFTQIQLKNLVLLLIVIWCIIPTFSSAEFGFSRLAWFVSLYIIGAYFSLYPPKIKVGNHIALCVFWSIVLFSSIIILEYLGKYHPIFSSLSKFFCAFNKLPVFMFSLELLLIFTNMKPRHSKLVNTVAASTFGIYLIHESTLLRPYIWKTLFNNTEYFGTFLFYVRYVYVVIIVFVTCGLIDFIVWQKVIAPLLNFILDKYLKRCVTFVSNIHSQIVAASKRLL